MFVVIFEVDFGGFYLYTCCFLKIEEQSCTKGG